MSQLIQLMIVFPISEHLPKITIINYQKQQLWKFNMDSFGEALFFIVIICFILWKIIINKYLYLSGSTQMCLTHMQISGK